MAARTVLPKQPGAREDGRDPDRSGRTRAHGAEVDNLVTGIGQLRAPLHPDPPWDLHAVISCISVIMHQLSLCAPHGEGPPPTSPSFWLSRFIGGNDFSGNAAAVTNRITLSSGPFANLGLGLASSCDTDTTGS